MDRVWRKVNQGLTNRSSKITTNVLNGTDTASTAGFDDPQVVGALTGACGLNLMNGNNINLNTSTKTGQRLANSGHHIGTINSESLSKVIITTASSERRRKRRRKSRPRRNGERTGSEIKTENSQQIEATSYIDGARRKKSLHTITAPVTTSDPSLRQRAVAKLRLFNFHLNWDLHMTQCKPCGPKSSGNILTRRLCRNRRRDDNELYRSNSFKFERFERKECLEIGINTLQKQISICDDYSLPIDFVKKRPSSFDPCLAKSIPDNWTVPSPLSEHVTFCEPQTIITHTSEPVELIEGYSDPKDSRKYIRTIRRTKQELNHCSSDSSNPKSTEDEEQQRNNVPELNSPDSISEDLVRPLQQHKSPKKIPGPDTSKRNPSPYYYSDLLKSKEETKEFSLRPRQSTASEPPHLSKPSTEAPYQKSISLDAPDIERDIPSQKRYSITEEGVRIIRCNTPSTTTSDDSDCSECQKRREWHAKALALVRETCNIPKDKGNGIENNKNNQANSSMPPHRLLGPAVCACTAQPHGDEADEFFRPRSIFYVHQNGSHECVDCSKSACLKKPLNIIQQEEEMSSGRTRQIYETAFDCKVAKSDDDLDETDRITNHSILIQLDSVSNGNNVSAKSVNEKSKSSKARMEIKRLKNSKNQAIQENADSISTLSQDINKVHISNNLDNMVNANTSQLPILGYTPSPPSTAPLPAKFPGKHDRFFMNSIKSAPNLPSSNPAHPRLKDLRLSVQKSNQHQNQALSRNDGSIIESFKSENRNCERPRSVLLESGRVLELRKSHHNHHQHGRSYSSTESMATSSSGGSMESLRSSTSEGNRSTTSSESRNSTSLSSHSSDSGNSISHPLRAPIVLHTKLHILSPISDKSSQEPASETSELNNRNGGFQKISPVDNFQSTLIPSSTGETTIEAIKSIKKRTIANKSLLHLTDEILGSDSGISLHSREDGKSKSAFHKFILPKPNYASDKCESILQSTTASQDLRDLPFDMPKLRRRKVLLQQDACTSGSATSVDLGDLPFDMPKLRRRLRMNQPQVTSLLTHSTESSGVSQASSSYSVRDENKINNKESSLYRHNLTLNLDEPKATAKFGSLDLKAVPGRGLNLNFLSTAATSVIDLIDVGIPLDRQGWYHGSLTRVEAESTLRPLGEGSFLVRNCESTKQDYSLSLKSAKGFMHMRIQRNETGHYILGQFSRPFESIPEMIRHFCLNRLPVRGAEHMCLLDPVIAQLL